MVLWRGVEGPNSELIFPIRLHMISGRRGWVCRIFIHLPFLPHHTFKWNSPKLITCRKTTFSLK